MSMGTTTATQTTHQKASQVDGTQTTPPPPAQEAYINGRDTQTSPPKNKQHRWMGQGQTDHNQEGQPANATAGQGKKTKKSTVEVPPHPEPSTGPLAGPRHYFTSRNLGTGRPTIQCTACSANIHTGEGNAPV